MTTIGSNCKLGIMEVYGFQPKISAKEPASYLLFNSLGVLLRHSHAQCLQINPKPFQQVVIKFFKMY